MDIKSRKRKNLTTVAIYNSLFAENQDKQKALITITLEDEKLTSLFSLRQDLISEIRKILRRVKYLDTKFAYFTNIELGFDKGALTKQFNPHIHFQFFYDNYEPIQLAVSSIEKKYHFKNFDTQQANNKNAYFGYVIKDYLENNFDEVLEANKMALGMKKPLYTSSRKNISNYVIKYIYNYCKMNDYQKWKELASSERYKFILDNIRDSKIIIKPSTEQLPVKFKTIKNYKIYIKI
ncbi:hypothetical protein [Sulfurimonas sp.]